MLFFGPRSSPSSALTLGRIAVLVLVGWIGRRSSSTLLFGNGSGLFATSIIFATTWLVVMPVSTVHTPWPELPRLDILCIALIHNYLCGRCLVAFLGWKDFSGVDLDRMFRCYLSAEYVLGKPFISRRGLLCCRQIGSGVGGVEPSRWILNSRSHHCLT